MSVITRTRAIIELTAVAGLVGVVAFNLFGCSAGNTTYGSSSTSSTGNSTSSTSAPTGTCATTYTPNYASLWQSGSNGVWSHTPIKVYFTNDLTVTTTTATPGVTSTASYETEVLNGFNQWTALLGSGITYSKVSSATGADIVVTFSTDTTTQSTAKWSVSATGTNYITSETATFTASSTGAIAPSLLQQMGAEAFGTMLGLPNSSNTTDITNKNTTATGPSTLDINTAKTLYCTYYQ
ncbi:MAG: hypothetical protein P4L33_15315 [Capsulimonadaceae bacterium]|nr:hypothetical protein [Capsulimonadaceae bacterium]